MGFNERSFVFVFFSEKCERFFITNYALQISNFIDLFLSTNSQIVVVIAHAKLSALLQRIFSNLGRK